MHPWLADAAQGIRSHPINDGNRWLIQTAMTLAVELTGALSRENDLYDRIAELELRLASALGGQDPGA